MYCIILPTDSRGWGPAPPTLGWRRKGSSPVTWIAGSYNAMACHVMLCYVMLYNDMLYHIILYTYIIVTISAEGQNTQWYWQSSFRTGAEDRGSGQ